MFRKVRQIESLESRILFNVAPAVLPGDANGDGIVNGQDIALISSQWLQTGNTAADVNHDNLVNGQDLALVASQWMKTPVTGFVQPEIQLDATDTSTVSTQQGWLQLHAAQGQYLTEPDSPALDSAFNHATQLTIEFQANQTTLGLDRTFISRWNYGGGAGSGSISIGTGAHYNQQDELSVWFTNPNGTFAGVVETTNANLKASVNYTIDVTYNAGQVSIYVNGVQQSTIVDSGTVPTSLAAANNVPFNVGYWPGLNRYIDGGVGGIKIWSVAKTADQIPNLATDNAGIVQSFGNDYIDTVTGAQLQNPGNAVNEQIVTSWQAKGTLPDLFTVSPLATAPDYVVNSPVGNKPSLKFNGLDNALKYAGSQLPNDNSGDIFLVVQFTGGGDNFEGDTIFSSSSDTTAVDYFFFASYNPSVGTGVPGAGTPLGRIRFRNDNTQADVRGIPVTIQAGVTYVMHIWGAGPGKGYGFTINGLNDLSSYYTTFQAGLDANGGSWFNASPNRTNLTIGDFERVDGPQGFAAAYISEIDLYAGTASQPVLPAEQSAAIVDYLMAKYGATRLGSDE